MFEGSLVFVVVPARDEAAHIRGVLETLPAWVDGAIVVDDGSRDGTGDAARAAGDARVEVLRHETSRGVGAAIVAGYARALERARGARAVLVVMAGDGQMDPRDLPALVAPVARGTVDYAKGNRLAWPGARAVMPLARYWGVRGFSLATTWAIGVPIEDSQCGYTALASAMCARLDLPAMWPGFGYPNDLLGLLAAQGARIAEVAVRPIYADEKSHLRLWHVPIIAGLVVRARLRRARA